MSSLNKVTILLFAFCLASEALAQPPTPQSYLPKRVVVGFHQWGEDAPLHVSGFLHLESAATGDSIEFPARLTESGSVVIGNNKGGALVVGQIGQKDRQRVNRSLSAPWMAGTSIDNISITVTPAFSAGFQLQRRGIPNRGYSMVVRSAAAAIELETYQAGADDFEARSPDFYLNFLRPVRDGIPFPR